MPSGAARTIDAMDVLPGMRHASMEVVHGRELLVSALELDEWSAQPITQPRMVEVRQNMLKQNDVLARELRRRFQAAGVFVVSSGLEPRFGEDRLPGEDPHAA